LGLLLGAGEQQVGAWQMSGAQQTAWKKLETLVDADAAPGGAVYVDSLDLQGGIDQIAAITGYGMTLYYDLGNPNNAYLGGKSYQLTGGGSISPVPEPASIFWTIGLATLAMRRARPARNWRRV